MACPNGAVVARPAVDDVVATIAVDRVIATHAADHVVAARALDLIGARGADDRAVLQGHDAATLLAADVRRPVDPRGELAELLGADRVTDEPYALRRERASGPA